MSHSNSSLNTFASCMAKYKHSYIDHTPPCKPPSPHLDFGVIAHDVLHKAGNLRDDCGDGLVSNDEYYSVIPSELIRPDLKDYFGIPDWGKYFSGVIKATAAYEQDIVQKLAEETHEPVQIEREIKLQLTVEQLHQMGYYKITQPVVGIIDLLIYTKTHAVILDYKFSAKRKTQDDFDMNSQLPLYAMFVHTLYDIPLHNIQYGYIDIPKQAFDKPILLSNGTLSRSKQQNVLPEEYKKFVNAIHATWYEDGVPATYSPLKNQECVEDEYYNCNEGGYYYDTYCALSLNKIAYLSIQYLDMDTYMNVTDDVLKAAELVDTMVANNMPFAKKYDAYSCSNCEYLNTCKSWLTVNGK